LCFTWVFCLAVTYFPAMLVLDQRRIEKKVSAGGVRSSDAGGERSSERRSEAGA
jgi:hypothetical protein